MCNKLIVFIITLGMCVSALGQSTDTNTKFHGFAMGQTLLDIKKQCDIMGYTFDKQEHARTKQLEKEGLVVYRCSVLTQSPEKLKEKRKNYPIVIDFVLQYKKVIALHLSYEVKEPYIKSVLLLQEKTIPVGQVEFETGPTETKKITVYLNVVQQWVGFNMIATHNNKKIYIIHIEKLGINNKTTQ